VTASFFDIVRRIEFFGRYFLLSAPLFGTVFAGYAVAKLPFWRLRWTHLASRAVFAMLVPALLFHRMSDLSTLPPVDVRLLIAFFGGCFVVFAIGRATAAWLFRLDGISQSIFALGGVFSNNVLLGLPMARATLGPEALPSVALVLVFNSLTLWTLVSVSIEWARHGALSIARLGKTAFKVLTNPIVAAILLGTACGLARLQLPAVVTAPLAALSSIAGPAALLVLGLGLAEHGFLSDVRQGLAISVLKLVASPLVVWGLAVALDLPAMERKVVVLLAGLSVGVNVYLMSIHFARLKAAVASSLVLSTALAVFTTPVLLALLRALE